MLNAYIHSNRSISADNRGSRRQPDEDSNDDFCIPIQIIFEEMQVKHQWQCKTDGVTNCTSQETHQFTERIEEQRKNEQN